MLKQVQHDDGRTDWTREEIAALFDLPFTELVFRAAEVHRAHHAADEVQLCTLLSIKTGGCPEDCGYCAQSIHAHTGLRAEKLMDVDAVLASARDAKAAGSQRFCMGAAWRDLKDRDLADVCAMAREVKALGLETCMTLGMLTADQARALADAGLDYYNHNIDTSPEHYGEIITTRTFQERLDTLEEVRKAGISVCCGGIVGMGESRDDRVGFIHALATLPRHPESVPINALVPVKGTVARRYVGRGAADRRYRVCAHGRGRAHHHADVDGPAVGRPGEHVGEHAGAVLPHRRE